MNITFSVNYINLFDIFVTIALAKRVSNMKTHLTNNSLFRVQRPGFWVKYSEIYSVIKSENNFSQQNGVFFHNQIDWKPIFYEEISSFLAHIYIYNLYVY